MPTYGTKPVVTLSAGDQVTLFDAETLTAPQASIAVAMAYKDGAGLPQVAVSIGFASPPTAVVAVQTANEDVEGSYVTITSPESTNTSPDIFQLPIGAAFVRLMLVSQSGGGALTAVLRRAS